MIKKLRPYLFAFFLVLSCCAVHGWHHVTVSLFYLPNNVIVPLSILTPLLLATTYLATYTLQKDSGARRPVAAALISTAAMLFLLLAGGLHLINYAARRYAGVMPFPTWQELPTGIVMLSVAALSVLHLTGLLICRFVKKKAKATPIVLSSIGWLLINFCLFFITV